MFDSLPRPQQEALRRFLQVSEGLTIQQVADQLSITAPSARETIRALVRKRYLEPSGRLPTAGRPVQIYRLTETGYALFPRQYALYSAGLMGALKEKLGSEGLRNAMSQLGREVAAQGFVKPELSLKERAEFAVGVMNQLAYEASAVRTGREGPGDPPVIEARNCVYHSIAVRYPEICEFDRSLLREVTGGNVAHEACILRGSDACRFRIGPDAMVTGTANRR